MISGPDDSADGRFFPYSSSRRSFDDSSNQRPDGSAQAFVHSTPRSAKGASNRPTPIVVLLGFPHHLAAAKYIAARIQAPVPLLAPLRYYSIDDAAVALLRSQTTFTW